MLLNSFFLGSHFNKTPIFEHYGRGDFSLSLQKGFYEIVMIGAGGGSATLRSSLTATVYPAQGGVGGTLKVYVKITRDVDLTIKIGAGGVSDFGTFASGGVGTTATDGTSTEITGYENLTLTAGYGTKATGSSTSSSSASMTVGVIGTNTISGSGVLEVLANNDIEIISTKQITRRENDNWQENKTYGASGSTIGSMAQIANDGYVRIIRV